MLLSSRIHELQVHTVTSCCICLTSEPVLACSNGHQTCAVCLEKHIRSVCSLSDPSAQQRLLSKAANEVVHCPFADINANGEVVSCEHSLPLLKIATLLPQSVDATIVPAIVWAASRKGEMEAAEKIQKKSREHDARKAREAEHRASEIMLKAALPNAYQCARCGHGPILHDHCANLSSHHGERVGNIRRSNACAKCGWFASDIKSWHRWDGRLQVEGGTEAVKSRTLFSVISSSLWRNSCRVEALVHYLTGAGMFWLVNLGVWQTLWQILGFLVFLPWRMLQGVAWLISMMMAPLWWVSALLWRVFWWLCIDTPCSFLREFASAPISTILIYGLLLVAFCFGFCCCRQSRQGTRQLRKHNLKAKTRETVPSRRASRQETYKQTRFDQSRALASANRVEMRKHNVRRAVGFGTR
mmetsp:Transcript_10533/g.17200  ORF Transcript_10533/g.17200 Transcript_10533/m.17200 type:complete len:414 (+) Transcript_10533:47-1288(+)